MTSSARRRLEVMAALAHYLGVGQDARFASLELKQDLGLEPLDLVLFVLGFEEAEGLAFPFEELERAPTVGALVELMADWLADYDNRERLADEDDRFGKESGMWSFTRRASEK